ncbi:MAG: pseudaminic acid synthase [bacterium]|nr:pseudaminic acid synthase [bacterium]MCP5067749.1 pseudaminic acid synthase [bacterium]
MNGFRLADRLIGDTSPPYVVAELSANHLGKLDRALAIVDAAQRAGADAIKLQTYTAESMTLDLDGPGFSIEEGPWSGRNLFELYAEAETPSSWHSELFERGRSLGLAVFSSPFDLAAVDFLETLDAPAYKIASFELGDHELIARAAATGKPLILSTGMAQLDEIRRALDVARANGATEIALLHCVSGYPTPPEEMNLLRVATLASEFGVVTGLSDHSLTAAAPVAAVALGARLIEKHITLSRADGGPDAGFSLEPDEFETMVRDVKAAWSGLGTGRCAEAPCEASSRIYRRSLYIVRDIAKGERISRESVRAIRPALGLEPRHLESVLGRSALRQLKRGEPLTWDQLEEPH